MRKRTMVLGLALMAAVGAGVAAYVASPTIHTGNPGESPEFGASGDYALGTVVKEFALADRSEITAWGALTGSLADNNRVLPVRFWYPAIVDSASQPAQYSHEMVSLRVSGNEPLTVISQGIAHTDAPPLEGAKFPFVLMSHGYGGWSTQFSHLAENIASKGYVVASIDHLDQHADGVVAAIVSFGNVLLGRTLDQRQILAQILADAEADVAAYARQIDASRVGLIGYSMGGYGAITSSGAPYVFDKEPLSSVPNAAKQQLTEAASDSLPIQALIAFAPWGAQPANRVWNAESLKNIDIPVMLVSGDQDDVVNFNEGVQWLYNSMTATERYMLVYREARHNIIGNHFELPSDAPFAALESLREPVWRSDRLNAINQHFVTAFLDMYLKGDTSKASYLEVPTEDSNASEWPTAFGEHLNGVWAGDEQAQHWKGFQKRWAVGMQLHHSLAEEAH